MVTICNVAWSVILLPSINFCSTPNLSARNVASFPPPCTRIFDSCRAAKSDRNEESFVSSSIILPPIFMTRSRFMLKSEFLIIPLVLPKPCLPPVPSPNCLAHRGSRHLIQHFFSPVNSASPLRCWSVQVSYLSSSILDCCCRSFHSRCMCSNFSHKQNPHL